jgi:hypothetical protein
MSKKYKFRVFLSPKSEIYELAFQLVEGSSERYRNLKLIPELANKLNDDDFETLIKELMQVLDLGAIESSHVKKSRFDASLRANAAIEEFKNLDVSQYLPSRGQQ